MKRAVVLLALLAASCGSAGAQEGSQKLSLRPFLRELDSPLFLTSAPGGAKNTVYVVEQVGRIRVAVNGRLRAKPFLDIRSKVRSGGEQGLLGLAFHPRYRTNKKFYVDYTDLRGNSRLVEYRGTRLVRQLMYFVDPYPNHNGGQLAFGPDGWLYFGMGDGGSGGDPQNRAQNLSSQFGKLWRINVNTRKPVVQIAGYGLRNPWRFSFDTNGDLYIADVGQNEWEEIDYTPRNSPGLENYGWNVYEGTHQFESKAPNSAGHLVMPVAEYSHSQGCSVTGGYVYRGSAIPSLRGRYIYGDFCSGRVWTLEIADGKATDIRQEGINVSNLSSFGRDASGELYATSLGGTVYKIAG